MRPALIVLVVLLLLLALVWFGQRALIYFPDRSAVGPAASALPGGQDLVLSTGDGLELGAWLFAPTGSANGVTVLVANGNGGNRAGRVPLASALTAAGFSVLLFDYRGYGGNPGSPSEEGLAQDAKAARAAIKGPVIYLGESLGAAVATRLAAADPPLGLVLRSPFTDLAAAGSANYPFLPVRWLLRDRFSVASTLAGIKVPTVVVYGSADSIVPAEQSRAVAATAGGPCTVIEVAGADHNDPSLQHGPELIQAVSSLVR
ncbi:alpha/beta hydrolase [Rhizocola hellebori]|uniref:alpha/beta hydrolase n=1 Tax=Rhizocola hellebori TaxID=1392758 RepID=UPI001EF30480|nr:alpha/beta hydrolase [Rhizocola hellebori]